MGLCVIMLQHKVMVVDKWHNNGSQNIAMVSLPIQYSINKIHLCLLSITYACPVRWMRTVGWTAKFSETVEEGTPVK